MNLKSLFTNRYVTWTAIILFTIIALDELALHWWKDQNPGASWSHIQDPVPLQNWTSEEGNAITNDPRTTRRLSR